MNVPGIEAALSLMTPHEFRNALRFVDAWERSGLLKAVEADEWRRRILARQRFLELEASRAADG